MYFLSGGISTHISPFATPQDIGAVLQGAGFVMITMDTEDITVRYPDLHKIMRDLQVSLGVQVGLQAYSWFQGQSPSGESGLGFFALLAPLPSIKVLFYITTLNPYLIINHMTQCKIILL